MITLSQNLLRAKLRTACMALLCSLSFLGLSHRSQAQTYCTTNLGGATYAWIDSVSIVGTTLQNGSGMASTYYTLFTGTANVTAILQLGSTYTLYLRFNGSPNAAISSMWIDYNQDGTFAASEWIQPSTNATFAAAAFTVPATALTGTTRMRIRSRGAGNTNGSTDGCTSFGSGETEDYNLTIASPVPCTGTPTAGTATHSPAQVCSGNTALMSLSGASIVSGLAYRWERYNTVTTNWDSVGNTLTYTTPPVTSQQIYRAVVRCTNAGGGQATSTTDTVNVLGTVFPYFETFESITSNNQLPQCMAATNLGGTVYTYTAPTGNYNQTNHTTPSGSKYLSFRYGATDWVFTPGLNLTANTTYRFSYWYVTDGYSGWTSQSVGVGTSQNASGMTTILGTVSNPTNTTYQQVSYTYTPNASGPYFFGIQSISNGVPWYLTIDDIKVEVLPPCSGAPVVTVSPSDSLLICPTANFTLTGNAGSFTGLTYQWDSSLSATGPWYPIIGATNPVYNSSASGGDVYYRLNVTCANGPTTTTSAQIKVKITGPAPATLPFFASFETWNNYCGNLDVPSGGMWQQANVINGSGNNAWRREDQGSTAGWTNATSGAYSPVSQHSSHSARFHTYATQAFMPQNGYDEGQLDLYLNLSGVTGSAGLYFFMNNPYAPYTYTNDSLVVLYSNNGGLSFQRLGGWDTATTWRKRGLNVPGGAAVTVIRFAARKWGPYDYTDIGIDSVYVAPPCNSTPVAGIVTPGGPITGCAGSQYSFGLNGTSMAGNINITWQSSPNGTTWTTIPGATGYTYTSGPVITTTYYRAVATCGGTGGSANSNAVQVTISSAVTPATLPYTEGFESWSTRCSTTDIPSVSWTNIPQTGDQSWRREDQGSSASWTGPTSGVYNPAAAVGNHSARFHQYYQPYPYSLPGTMDLYVDASAAGAKELQYYARVGSPSYAYDSLSVSYSSNGGQTWQWINGINQTTGWQYYTHALTNALTANTIIRFRAYGYSYVEDIGIDNVRVLPACTGVPTAGTIVPVTPCPNINFDLKLVGTSAQGGLTYQWRYINAPTPLNSVPGKANPNWTTPTTGGNTAIWTSQISQSRYVQVIVTCPNSNQRDTSATYYVQTAPFNQCYCASFPYYPSSAGQYYGGNIGNVTLKSQPAGTVILNNGTATPASNNPTSVNSYTPFYNLTPTPLYKDSVYRASVAEISYYSLSSNTPVSIFIDYNQDGIFDPTTERVVAAIATGATVPSYTTQTNFTVPATAKTGVTGMRVILADYFGTTTQPSPCGQFNYYGETEDYLVEVRDHPCSGQANAGTALVSDTSICSGYKVTLTDTTYEKQQYGLVRRWQQSTDGGQSWQNVGGINRDTLQPTVAGTTWYRLRIRCTITGDSSFSNVVTVSLNPPYACYCVSYATGGQYRDNDSSDIGAFVISKPVATGSPLPVYVFTADVNSAGPHLLNPLAVRTRTDYTKATQSTPSGFMELWADSTYQFDMYHILRGLNHHEAKVTLFMDFNNNLQYEAAPGNGYPAERVWSTTTAVTDWYKSTEITIPSQQVITEVPTGMRLIINENTAPNIPSDEACGVYDAGETEDYVVVFRKVGGVQGVSGISSLKSLGLYPNPTGGKTTLMYTADKAIKELDITVTNMTGQVMLQQSFTAPGKQFSTELDLSDRPRGVYFIELRADGEKAVRKLVVR